MEWVKGKSSVADTAPECLAVAVLEAGLTLTGLTEHQSVPWEALPGLMELDPEVDEYRLAERPERLPASFTLTAVKPL